MLSIGITSPDERAVTDALFDLCLGDALAIELVYYDGGTRHLGNDGRRSLTLDNVVLVVVVTVRLGAGERGREGEDQEFVHCDGSGAREASIRAVVNGVQGVEWTGGVPLREL